MCTASSDTDTSKSWLDFSIQEVIGDTTSEYEIRSLELDDASSIPPKSCSRISNSSIVTRMLPKVSDEHKSDQEYQSLSLELDETSSMPPISCSKISNSSIIVTKLPSKASNEENDRYFSQEVILNDYTYTQTSEVPSLVCRLPINLEPAPEPKEKLARLSAGEIGRLFMNRHSCDCNCPKCVCVSKYPPPVTKFLYFNNEKQVYRVNKSASSYTCPNERRSRIPISTNPMLFRGLACTCYRCRCYPLDSNPDKRNSLFAPNRDEIINEIFDKEKEKLIAAGGFRPIVYNKEEIKITGDLCNCKPCECDDTCAGKKPGCSCTEDVVCNTCNLENMKKELEELVSQVQKLRKTIPGSFRSIHEEES